MIWNQVCSLHTLSVGKFTAVFAVTAVFVSLPEPLALDSNWNLSWTSDTNEKLNTWIHVGHLAVYCTSSLPGIRPFLDGSSSRTPAERQHFHSNFKNSYLSPFHPCFPSLLATDPRDNPFERKFEAFSWLQNFFHISLFICPFSHTYLVFLYFLYNSWCLLNVFIVSTENIHLSKFL